LHLESLILQRVETNPFVTDDATDSFQNWKLLIVDSPPRFLLETQEEKLSLTIKPLFGMSNDESIIAMTIPEIRTV
jgi:hypothetical protein